MVAIGESCFTDNLGNVVAEIDAERLPLNRQKPVALQIAKRAVVGHQFESVVRAFEGPPGSVATVLAISHVGPHERRAIVVAHCLDATHRLGVGHRGVCEDHGLEDSRFTLGVVGHEAHVFSGLVVRNIVPHGTDEIARRTLGRGQVVSPGHAALGDLHTLEERRDHLHEFVEHHLGVFANFG